ncbi:MAG TPA: MFS transporter, partial [Dehalococcoidales bacterium]
WRWVFFINLPIGIIVLLLIPRAIKATARQTGSLDLAGGLTVTGGMMGLVYGLSRAGSHSFSDTQAIISLALAAILLVTFVIVESRNPRALMPLRIFANRNRSATYAIALAIGASVFSVFFFLTLFVQNILGYSPLRAGFSFLPLTAGIVIMATVISRVVGKIGPRIPMAAGALVAAGGLFWSSHLSPGSGYVSAVLAPTLVLAFGLGAIFVPMSLLAVSGVKQSEAGLSSALLNAGQQIGGSLGLAILVNVATTVTNNRLNNGASQIAATTAGYSRAFLVAAGIALIASVIAFLAIRNPKPNTPVKT